MEAVKRDDRTLGNIPEELVMAATKACSGAYKPSAVNEALEAMKKDSKPLKGIPKELITPETRMAAMKEVDKPSIVETRMVVMKALSEIYKKTDEDDGAGPRQ